MNEDLNPKNRGLGRGLNALFEDDDGVYPQSGEEASASGRKRLSVPIGEIVGNADQPRHVFYDESLGELAESIKAHGILQPLLVRPLADSGVFKYELIAGERRWRAAQMARLHEVPVVILELTEEGAYEVALIENLQREDLDPIDEAQGYEHMISAFGYTQDKVAKAVGKSRPHVANMLRILTLPDGVRMMVRDGKISAGHARAIASSDNPEALAAQIISGSMNVRQAEALAGGGKSGKKAIKTGGSPKARKDPDTLALEADLSVTLGMAVTIDSPNGKAGTISIAFKDLDQLDDVLQRLSSASSRRLMG